MDAVGAAVADSGEVLGAGAVFDALDSPAAIVDASGRIVAVNAAWSGAAAAAGDASRCGVGVSYLAVCDAAAGAHAEGAVEVAAGLRAVLAGERAAFVVDYSMPIGGATRWFDLRISGLPTGGAVIVHHDVTAVRLAELTARFDDARVLRAFDESSPIFALVDPDGTVAHISDRTCELFGLDRAEVVGVEAGSLLDPDDAERIREVLAEVAAVPGRRRNIRFRALDAAGRRREVDATVVNLLDDVGVRAIAFVGSDVTDLRVHEIASRVEGRLLQHFPVAVVISDEAGVIAYWNDRAEQLTGVPRSEAVGRRLAEIGVVTGDQRAAREVARQLAAERRWEGDYEFIVPDGTRLPLHLSLERVDDEEIDFHGVVGTAIDVSERRRLERELEFQAHHDPLTGLPNRRHFVEQVEAVLSRAAEARTAVVFVDLDDFKELNDRVGHGAGDQALRVMAERFRQVLRSDDLVARIGGDEFVAALVDIDGAEAALAVADRLLDALSTPLVVDGVRAQLSGSVGVAMASGDVGPEVLLRNADAAMYEAKELGKNRVALFDDALRERARSRHAFARELRQAVADGRVHAHLQPQRDLATGALVGFEALARWEGEDGGHDDTAHFLEVAEQGGVVGDIDRVVLSEAVEALRRFRQERPDLDVRVSVNVSGELLADAGFPAQVVELLAEHGVRAGSLAIEVVESALADTHAVAENLRRLEACGVEVSIDDFGTGYSSLSRIQQFHVDELKIDRSFVAGLGADDGRDAIVEAIIGLAKALGLRTVAEGVETEPQVLRLRELGVDAGQGFWWSPALTVDQAVDLVRAAPPAGRPSEAPAG